VKEKGEVLREKGEVLNVKNIVAL